MMMKSTVAILMTVLCIPLSAETPRAAVCYYDQSHHSVLLPAVAEVQGRFGTYFVSDVTIANYKAEVQKVRIEWLPQDGQPLEGQLTLAPLEIRQIRNFVGTVLGTTGVGAVIVTAINEYEQPMNTGYLDATSRIWTMAPDGSGTTSQSLSARMPDDLRDWVAAHIIGMRGDEHHRMNVGIVNLGTYQRSWSVRVRGESRTEVFTVTVPARSMKQVAAPDGIYGGTVISVLPFDATGSAWSAYGVSLDNRTGDGWVVHGVHP